MKVGRLFEILLVFLVAIGIAARVLSFYVEEIEIPAAVAAPITVVREALTPHPEPTTILVVGDIMLGRHVRTLMRKNGNDHPFEHITELLNSVDMVIGNLEGPITTRDGDATNTMQFSFDPSVAETLAQHNIETVSVANNHAFDQGKEGYKDTEKYLTDAGVEMFGKRGTTETGSVYVVPRANLAFIGLDTTIQSHDREELRKELQSVPPEITLAVVIHWGNEYEMTHNDDQMVFAHFLIDNGVDVIFGAHPHVVQDIGLYNNKPIFYSLGNFIFDQYWNDDVQTGLAIKITIDEDVTYELIPLSSEQSQPFPMSATTSQAFLDSRGLLSTFGG
ncbi:MAG: CapA family protein [Patescibacteria group bacterium]